MGFELIIRNRAQVEIAKLVRDYERREVGLGAYFLICLDATFEGLVRFPTALRVVRHDYRRCFVRKFPVSIYYLVQGQKVVVDVVEHMKRDPERLEVKLKR